MTDRPHEAAVIAAMKEVETALAGLAEALETANDHGEPLSVTASLAALDARVRPEGRLFDRVTFQLDPAAGALVALRLDRMVAHTMGGAR